MHARVLGTIGLAIAASFFTVSAAQAQDRHHDSGDSVECVSRNHDRQRCDIPWRDAQLERQLSDTACVRDKNWGVDRQGIWVNHGCAGRFVAVADRGHSDDRSRHGRDNRGDERGGWQPDANWNRRFLLTCESQDARYHFCQIDLGGAGRASLARQLSDTRCVEGRNWGSNRAGVWVSQGCRGQFSVDRRWR